MAKILRRLLVLCSCIAIAALLLSYFGRRVDPQDAPYIGLFQMGYPLVLLSNILLLIFWVILKKRKWALAHLIALLLTWSIQSDFIQLWPKNISKGEFKVMTFNTQLLGFYQFKRNKELRDDNLAMLDSLDADIFCFQEFYKTDNPKGFQTLSLIQEQLGPLELHEKYTHEFVHKQYFGVVTMSKYPILNRGYIAFEADINNFCIYSDILLPSEDTIRVFNGHLASIHFKPEDFAFSRGEFENWDEFKAGFEHVKDKLQAANSRRSVQIDRILQEVEKSPYPTILAGDLNAPPFTNAYYKTRRALQDAFNTAGFGIAETYTSKIPVLRIDHIFHDDRIEVKSFKRVHSGRSDHYPVLVEFDLEHD